MSVNDSGGAEKFLFRFGLDFSPAAAQAVVAGDDFAVGGVKLGSLALGAALDFAGALVQQIVQQLQHRVLLPGRLLQQRRRLANGAGPVWGNELAHLGALKLDSGAVHINASLRVPFGLLL